MARTRTLLSRDSWIEAGQELLREGGITAVKLHALRRRLGVTTGSFYHHFEDFGAYLDALADAYGTTQVARVDAELDGLEPMARVLGLRRMMDDWDVPLLDSAMRVWATSSDRAAQAVSTLDHRLLTVIHEALCELGFDAADARVRATLAYAAGAGLPLVQPPWNVSREDVDASLALLLTPPA